MSNTSPKITFEMLSDWHIGTGSGIPGSVDALVARDADGFPCIPAKTVVGIWRDAMETLTFGLDGGNETNKIWQNWVDVIFGSQPNIDKNPNATPRPAILSVHPARIDENLRKAIKGDVKLEQTLTFVKPNTKIDAKSGTAESESLRFTEMGRIGSILSAVFSLDFTKFEETQKELVNALLTASATLVERIGGNRRRGSGKCEMKIDCGEIDAIAVLKKYEVASLPSIPDITAKVELESAQNDNASEWKRIEYSLKLETPMAIVTATLGNVSETLDFIPGTYLLPHITKHLKVSKYIASGDFQVSPATIEVNGNRGLPVPKVIHYHKVEGGFYQKQTVYNRLEEDISGGEQKKNYREGFVSSLDEFETLPLYETTKKILLMHNTVEDEVQRPTENVGGVFSREAIEAGQVLKGEIRLKKSIFDNLTKHDEKWLENLKSYVRLGTSKKDDYGLACFEILDDLESTTPELKNSKLVVYLASDVLLRNSNLQQTNLVADLKTKLEDKLETGTLKSLDDFLKPFQDELSKLSETEKAKKDKINNEIEKIKKEKESLIYMIQVRRIESWHEGWGFPRPTFTAMAAGSVAVFEVVGEIKPQNLQNLELSGIGERRGEGYGQIKFNPKILTNPINTWKVPSKDDDKAKLETKTRKSERTVAIEELKNQIKTADKFKKFVENLEVSAWHEEIARAVLKIANEPERRKEIFGFDGDMPSMSQIGGLRSAIGRLKKVETDNDSESVVTNWLKHLQATQNRLKKWGDSEESAKNNLRKIKNLVQSETLVWEKLKSTDKDGRAFFTNPCSLISEENNLNEKLWTEAVKSLFDACARAHKRDEERKKDNREDKE